MNQYLFLFTIGPVQSFIAQARKTQDLYAGSRILSDLIRFAMNQLPSNTKHIFPAKKNASSNPNRFVAVVQAHDIQTLGDDLKKDVENEFATGECFGERLKYLYEHKDQDCEDQLRDFLKVYWAAVPVVMNADGSIQDYVRQYKRLEQLMGAVKSVRTFSQFAEKGRKCSINGEYNVRFYRKSEAESKSRADSDLIKRKKLFHEQVRIFGKNDGGLPIGKLQPGEGLCGISLLKRLYGGDDEESFESTAEIATMDALDKLRRSSSDMEQEIHELLKIDEQFIYSDAITKTAVEQTSSKESITNIIDWQKAIEAAAKGYAVEGMACPLRLSKYYAILLFDADSMGARLGSAASEQEHHCLSELLAGFAQKAQAYIDHNRFGRTVYAGGDDFLGFLNLNHLFPAMRKLRLLFDEKVNRPLQEKNLPHLQLTFTAGVSIAHYKTPLSEVLAWARNMEKKAKKIDGIAEVAHPKDAIGMAVLKRSGEIHEAVLKWQYDGIWSLDVGKRLMDALLDERLSPKFIKTISATFELLMGEDGSIGHVPKELLQQELTRVMLRQAKGNKASIAALSDDLFKLYDRSSKAHDGNLQHFLNFLHICEFISRSLNSSIRPALVQAFRDGKISSGKAAQMLQIPRVDFFDVLADFGVDIYNDVSADTLKQDRANA